MTIQDAIGCWRTPSGYTLIHPSGLAKVKLTGRGAACDVDGDWVWEQTGESAFVVTRTDVEASEEPQWRQAYTIRSYDGRMLELEHRSLFYIDPDGVLAAAFWQKAELPQSWSNLVWDE